MKPIAWPRRAAARKHRLAAAVVGGSILALSLMADAQQSYPTYYSSEPPYGTAAPTYQNTWPHTPAISHSANNAILALQHIEFVVDYSLSLLPARRAKILAEIDVALFELRNSNAPDLSTVGTSHPAYDTNQPRFGRGYPTYDNTTPPSPPVPFDVPSSAKSLRDIRDQVLASRSLNAATKKATAAALEAAIADLEPR